MSSYFFDASAIVKRYAPEPGNAWVTGLTDPASGHGIVIAEITLVEVAAALAAKARTAGGLTVSMRDAALSAFLADCGSRFLLLGADRAVIDRAVDLTQRHPLRGYDAVQLATATVANADLLTRGIAALVLVSADRNLLIAAAAEGLATDDPNAHP